MKSLILLIAIVCVAMPGMADAGCRGVRSVRIRHAGVHKFSHGVYGGVHAQFVAVEQPVYLSLVAAQKRQELQRAEYEAAVQAGVQAQLAQSAPGPAGIEGIVEKLEQLRAELERLRRGDTNDSVPPAAASPPAAGPVAPVPTPHAPSSDGTAGASPDLVKFFEAKCAQCHTGAGAEAGFALFGEDGRPQLTPGKLIQADLATYSNRMPPKEKLTEEEYGGFRALYQSWERDLREFARKEKE